MSEEHINGDAVHEYAENNEKSPFEKVLPEKPIQAKFLPTKIPYSTKAGTTRVIALEKKNKYHQIIFRACFYSFQSDWFNGLGEGSQNACFYKAQLFFDWINESRYKTTSKTRYTVLKVFEAYQMNDLGKNRSPLAHFNKFLHEGIACPTLTGPDYEYLLNLLSLSKPVENAEPKSCTLTSWFELPWLRSVIDESTYLQLESPRLLLKSFRITIAATLLYLLDQRKHWQKSSVIEFKATKTEWQYDWNRLVLDRIGNFNDKGEPEDDISQLLLLDLVKPFARVTIENRIAKSGTQNLPRTIFSKEKFPWQRPVYFHPDYQTRYSALEEMLCGWLAACEGIQPTDIPKLKATNYVRERYPSGRLITMECTYYKSRSDSMKQPAILIASDLWTQAMDCYITGLSDHPLFKTNIAAEKHLTWSATSTELSLLFKIWKLPSFLEQLESKLTRASTDQLFLRSMLALENGSENYSQFYFRTKKSIEEYRAIKQRPLPNKIFSLTHIKNTAVHAGSDSYRESDLINHHSHSALTEKSSYLNDANKEWVNQAGRITRLVLHDLQNVVYKPSIKAISDSVKDLELRTRISETTHKGDVKIHSLQGSPVESASDNAIIVVDAVETALYFIHYITQAEALLPKLLAVRPDWVERTLIIQIEWMTRTLTRMGTAASAQKCYAKLSVHLPPLFVHLLESTE